MNGRDQSQYYDDNLVVTHTGCGAMCPAVWIILDQPPSPASQREKLSASLSCVTLSRPRSGWSDNLVLDSCFPRCIIDTDSAGTHINFDCETETGINHSCLYWFQFSFSSDNSVMSDTEVVDRSKFFNICLLGCSFMFVFTGFQTLTSIDAQNRYK